MTNCDSAARKALARSVCWRSRSMSARRSASRFAQRWRPARCSSAVKAEKITRPAPSDMPIRPLAFSKGARASAWPRAAPASKKEGEAAAAARRRRSNRRFGCLAFVFMNWASPSTAGTKPARITSIYPLDSPSRKGNEKENASVRDHGGAKFFRNAQRRARKGPRILLSSGSAQACRDRRRAPTNSPIEMRTRWSASRRSCRDAAWRPFRPDAWAGW